MLWVNAIELNAHLDSLNLNFSFYGLLGREVFSILFLAPKIMVQLIFLAIFGICYLNISFSRSWIIIFRRLSAESIQCIKRMQRQLFLLRRNNNNQKCQCLSNTNKLFKMIEGCIEWHDSFWRTRNHFHFVLIRFLFISTRLFDVQKNGEILGRSKWYLFFNLVPNQSVWINFKIHIPNICCSVYASSAWKWHDRSGPLSFLELFLVHLNKIW